MKCDGRVCNAHGREEVTSQRCTPWIVAARGKAGQLQKGGIDPTRVTCTPVTGKPRALSFGLPWAYMHACLKTQSSWVM